MRNKVTVKIFKILLVIFLVNLLACNNNQQPKGKPEANTNGINMYRNIEFKSQGAILRGRLYLPDNKLNKSPLLLWHTDLQLPSTE